MGKAVSGAGVLLDPDDPNPDRRYKLFYCTQTWTTAGDSYYGLTVIPYAGAYLGLLQVFHRQAPNCGYLEEQLVISDDARRWRPAGDSMFLTAGEPGAWDCGSVGAAPRVVVRDQDLLFYYSGTPRSHGGGTPPPLPEDGLGLAILRRDGFACLWPPWHEGVLTTHPDASSGQTLRVNTDAACGQVSAAVQDSSSRPLPGYAHDDCLPVRADSTDALLRWQRHAALPVGQGVQIEFRVREASLYSFALDQPE
jgi:hypothetical protein